MEKLWTRIGAVYRPIGHDLNNIMKHKKMKNIFILKKPSNLKTQQTKLKLQAKKQIEKSKHNLYPFRFISFEYNAHFARTFNWWLYAILSAHHSWRFIFHSAAIWKNCQAFLPPVYANFNCIQQWKGKQTLTIYVA